jgi:hypothetical protein
MNHGVVQSMAHGTIRVALTVAAEQCRSALVGVGEVCILNPRGVRESPARRSRPR